MTNVPIGTVIRMLRIALGYGSRTERITRLICSTDVDVSFTAISMRASGYLKPIEGTVEISPT